MDYYSQQIVIPQVDENDKIIGSVERWLAHETGILHSGFTVSVFYKNAILCQHRKHPLFDGVLDLTASSHPIIEAGNIIPSLEMVYQTLQREWNINKDDLLVEPRPIGKVLYKSSDGHYVEHEMCEFFSTEIDYLPYCNSDYSYGQSLLPVDKITDQAHLAPWVKAAFEARLYNEQSLAKLHKLKATGT